MNKEKLTQTKQVNSILDDGEKFHPQHIVRSIRNSPPQPVSASSRKNKIFQHYSIPLPPQTQAPTTIHPLSPPRPPNIYNNSSIYSSISIAPSAHTTKISIKITIQITSLDIIHPIHAHLNHTRVLLSSLISFFPFFFLFFFLLIFPSICVEQKMMQNTYVACHQKFFLIIIIFATYLKFCHSEGMVCCVWKKSSPKRTTMNTRRTHQSWDERCQRVTGLMSPSHCLQQLFMFNIIQFKGELRKKRGKNKKM